MWLGGVNYYSRMHNGYIEDSDGLLTAGNALFKCSGCHPVINFNWSPALLGPSPDAQF